MSSQKINLNELNTKKVCIGKQVHQYSLRSWWYCRHTLNKFLALLLEPLEASGEAMRGMGRAFATCF